MINNRESFDEMIARIALAKAKGECICGGAFNEYGKCVCTHRAHDSLEIARAGNAVTIARMQVAEALKRQRKGS